MTGKQKKRTFLIGAIALVLVGASAFWAFAPWAIWYNQTVDEAAPAAEVAAMSSDSSQPSPTGTGSAAPAHSSAPQAVNIKLAAGTFQSYEHQTTGTATLLRTTGEQTVVRLTDFATSNGPDVRVYISTAGSPDDEHALETQNIDLGALKGNIGNQNYTVPAAAQGTKWNSVVIWCRRFSVAFGAAPLTPAPPSPRG